MANKTPLILQAESAECGLACLAMIFSHFGRHVDLADLRVESQASSRGLGLSSLMEISSKHRLHGRALKVDPLLLKDVRLPCVLHWDQQHFVTLVRVSKKYFFINDPAVGRRRIKFEELSKHFTGIALELWPAAEFAKAPPKPRLRLRNLMGQMSGFRRTAAYLALFALTLEALSLLMPHYMKLVIDEAISASDESLLLTLIAGFSCILALQQTVAGVRGWTLTKLAADVSFQWRGGVFLHLLQLPINFFERRRVGDVVSKFSSIEYIQRALTTSAVEVLMDGLMVFLTLSIMMLTNPGLAAVSLITAALYLALRLSLISHVRSVSEELASSMARQQGHFLETLRGIKTIKCHQKESLRSEHWLGQVVTQLSAAMRNEQIALCFRISSSLLFGFERLIVIYIGAHSVLDSLLTIGGLIAYLAYREQFTQRMSSGIDKIMDIKLLEVHKERLGEIVLHKKEPEQPINNTNILAGRSAPPKIELRNLGFRYGAYDRWVFRNLSMTIEAGESVALVGPSGCGKSTLLGVMLGVVTPCEGTILVDGKELKWWEGESIRGISGAILQDDTLFAGTISQNIVFFDKKPDKARMEACAKMAQIDSDILAMPMRYSTLVGDMGSSLSGGQRQRVLLARALYRNPSILLMDEATSHLDPVAEHRVNDAIRCLPMTRVIIAHRQETIQSADRVIHFPTEQSGITPAMPQVVAA